VKVSRNGRRRAGLLAAVVETPSWRPRPQKRIARGRGLEEAMGSRSHRSHASSIQERGCELARSFNAPALVGFLTNRIPD
jgi:hypothetical protein